MFSKYVLILLIVNLPRFHGYFLGEIDENSAGSTEFNPEYLGGTEYGDMMFPQGYLRGAAHRPETQRWPNGFIPYEIQPSISLNHTELIVDAMRRMENLTRVNDRPCIRFRPKTDQDDIFITIQNGSGCSAYVGYLQGITLNRTVSLYHSSRGTCMRTGIIQHELLHVLGFFHEQSRPDRDEYVLIRWENIQNGTQSNFNKYSEIDIDLLMTEYDYESVMHYEANAFSSNGQPTIIPTKNATAFIGQRLGMSPIDVLEVQRYYGCLALPTTTTSTTTSTTPTTTTTTTSTTSTTPTTTTTMGPTVISSTSSCSAISNEICLTMLLLVVPSFGKHMLL